MRWRDGKAIEMRREEKRREREREKKESVLFEKGRETFFLSWARARDFFIFVFFLYVLLFFFFFFFPAP